MVGRGWDVASVPLLRGPTHHKPARRKNRAAPVGMTDWEKAKRKSFNTEGTEEEHGVHRERKASERWILGLAIIRG